MVTKRSVLVNVLVNVLALYKCNAKPFNATLYATLNLVKYQLLTVKER